MTLKKLLLTIAGALAIIGTFLPWVAVTFFVSVKLNPFQMGEALPIILAILALLCGTAAILLNVLKEKQIKDIVKIKSLDKLPLYVGIALTAIAVIAFIYVKASTSGVANASFGIWMIGIAGVATIVLPLLKNIDALDKTVIGQPEKSTKSEKSEKSDKSDKKPAAKKTTK